MINSLRKPMASRSVADDVHVLAATANATDKPGPQTSSAAKLDPLVEALGLAVARNAIRDRTLSAA